MIHNPGFKGVTLFDVECLTNGNRHTVTRDH